MSERLPLFKHHEMISYNESGPTQGTKQFPERFIPLHQLNASFSLCKSLHHGFDPSILNHFIVWYMCVHGSDMRHHRLMVKGGWGGER